jgi:interferon gamma-inducible protein 30
LCPDCRGKLYNLNVAIIKSSLISLNNLEFISEQVWGAFYSLLPIMNLTLIPYGNAKESFDNKTKLWKFTCQHGADECWGNLFHSCLINYYPQVQDHFQVIYCMEYE